MHYRTILSLGIALAFLSVAGCGSSDETTAVTRTIHAPHPEHVHKRQRPRIQHVRRLRRPQQKGRACPPKGKTLKGVYHPERLSILDPCRKVTGRVALVRDYEEDGDLHFDIAVTDKSLLAANNYGEQDGFLVVELMPRDHRHLPAPTVGDRVNLIGAWVDDTLHGWNEIHPVFGIQINGGRWQRSGPRFGGSPPYTRSDDSLALCRTASGSRCMGYNGVVAPPPENHEPGGSAPPPSTPTGKCDPSYPTVCIPSPPPDLDCGEIPYRNFKVVGADPHGFDSDGDGVGCES